MGSSWPRVDTGRKYVETKVIDKVLDDG